MILFVCLLVGYNKKWRNKKFEITILLRCYAAQTGSYRRFGTTYTSGTACPLKMGPDRLSRNVGNHQSALGNISEQLRSHLHSGVSPKPTKLPAAAPNICRSSVLQLLHVTSLVPRILKRILDFFLFVDPMNRKRYRERYAYGAPAHSVKDFRWPENFQNINRSF
jgi:hypothetical protein